MKKYVISLLIIYLMVSCNNSNQKKDENITIISKSDTLISKNEIEIKEKVKKNKHIAKDQSEEMFCIAINNFSTAPFYVVITVKNLKTGQVKEVCTEAPFVLGAIDYKYDFNNLNIDCEKFPNQYFELSTKKALSNVQFDLYTKQELEEFSKTINIELIIQHIKEGKLKSRVFGYDYAEFNQYLTNQFSTEEINSKLKEQNWDEIEREQIMFAHIMYKNGIMMTRGCVASNCCGLLTIEQAKKK